MVQGYSWAFQGYPWTVQWYPLTVQGYPWVVQGYPWTVQGYPWTVQGYPLHIYTTANLNVKYVVSDLGPQKASGVDNRCRIISAPRGVQIRGLWCSLRLMSKTPVLCRKLRFYVESVPIVILKKQILRMNNPALCRICAGWYLEQADLRSKNSALRRKSVFMSKNPVLCRICSGC